MKKKSNKNLNNAKKAKNDEFYTSYKDIEKEISNYKDYLKGKWIYSPCDDYRWSEFKNYFVSNFTEFGLKHYTCTCYDIGDGAWRYDYDGVNETITKLEENGDFRSEECIELLKECDAVITNPPFSLFREFVAQLMKYGKKFLIIGNKNALTYKEIFPYIKNNELWQGMNWIKDFVKPNGEINKFGNACWFTNIPHIKQNKPLILTKTYNPIDYPHYDNYDAINVDKLKDIPMDYDGIMGVPITFLYKSCPTQFEIVGCADADIVPTDWKGMSAEFIKTYYAQGNTGQYKAGNRLACYIYNGIAKVPYKRILIRRI